MRVTIHMRGALCREITNSKEVVRAGVANNTATVLNEMSGPK